MSCFSTNYDRNLYFFVLIYLFNKLKTQSGLLELFTVILNIYVLQFKAQRVILTDFFQLLLQNVFLM